MKTLRYRELLTILTHMPMFDEEDLLFFDPFKFEDGTSKPKFFVVLKNENGLSLLASLPTSKDYIPADLDVHASCYEFPERGVNATKGKLKQDLFDNLKEYLKNSRLVKNKFKRML